MQELVQYVKRDMVVNNAPRRTKVGMFYCRKVNNVPTIFWCKVNWKAGDTFDLVEGRRVAEEEHAGRGIPSRFKKIYNKFHDRCRRYFKEEPVLG